MNFATISNFFGPDMILIFLVVLIFFGAKRLPELAKGLGQAIREFSKAKDDFSNEMTRPPEPPAPPSQITGDPKVTVEHDHKGKVMSEAHETRNS